MYIEKDIFEMLVRLINKLKTDLPKSDRRLVEIAITDTIQHINRQL